ncbi:MAG: hypothetical protein ISS82_00050 [Nanoarchaeota archaeon]|nr:hypothetical protein [Nanoarchaeota archaeon]
MKKDPLDKWLYFLIIVMGVYFLIRIIDQTKMISIFPLVNNDLGSYVAQLHMLKICGFHNFCPYWYNGFITFLISSPGWQFFTYPLYLMFNNILFSTYISNILMYTIGFIFIYYLGKGQKFSRIKIIAFFVIMFGNSINIGNFIFQGRMSSLNATVFFLGLAAVIYFYKSHKIDKKFILFFVPINVLVILSHYQEAALAQVLVLSLFLIKKGYEKIIITLSFILSLILSAFWWVPFLLESFNLKQSSILINEQGKWLAGQIIPKIEFSTQFFTTLLIIIIPIVLFMTFYFYWISKKKSFKILIFYSPILILNLLFWLRLTAYIPLLKHISPDPFLIFFLFFILITFFKTNFKFFPKILRTLIISFLIILPLANVIVSHTQTPYWDTFEYGLIEKNILSLLDVINPNEKFVFVSRLPFDKVRYSSYYYAYATIYKNLSTPGGYYYHIASPDYRKGLHQILDEKNCSNIRNIMYQYNTSYAIGYGEKCNILGDCGFERIKKEGDACLYRLNNL